MLRQQLQLRHVDQDEYVHLGDPRTWEPYTQAPFRSYNEMVPFLKGVQAANDDALVLLDGLEGSGKSTVGFRLANHLDPTWEPETGLIIDFDDWEEVYDLGRRRVFLLDEGGDLLFSRDAMRGENKLVVRMFQMARIYNHIIIVLCPNIHWVDLYIRDHRALIYGHTHKGYHSTGVSRGLVSWNWPDRRFDWKTSEWTSRWNGVVDSRFAAINPSLPKWKRYEAFKMEKVQKRREDITAQVKKAKKKR